MAIDRVKQVGKSLNKTRKDIDHTTRKIQNNLPVREGNNDLIGSLYPYKFEFKAYASEAVFLDIMFEDKFDEKIGEPWLVVTG